MQEVGSRCKFDVRALGKYSGCRIIERHVSKVVLLVPGSYSKYVFFSEYHPAHRPLRHQLEITSPSKFTVRCMNPRTLKIYRSPLPEFSVTRNRFLVSPYSDTSSSDLWASGRFILPHTTHDTTCPFSEGRSRRPPRQCVYFRGFVLMSL